jgi:hypothetical protein
MRDSVKNQSEVGFDDDISDRFSKPPIDSEIAQSQESRKSSQRGDQGTMMMGSVVPQPKIHYT